MKIRSEVISDIFPLYNPNLPISSTCVCVWGGCYLDEVQIRTDKRECKKRWLEGILLAFTFLVPDPVETSCTPSSQEFDYLRHSSPPFYLELVSVEFLSHATKDFLVEMSCVNLGPCQQWT